MSLSDYAHHNEDAQHIWWSEEGRHAGKEYDPFDLDYGVLDRDEDYCDGCGEDMCDCECDDDLDYVREDFGWDGGLEA